MSENLVGLLIDVRKARRGGEDALAVRQRRRLAEMVAFARSTSPYYRELYRDIVGPVENPAPLPVTDKIKLMERFNDWVTDRAVTIEDIRAFVSNPELVGERLLGRYTVATTSGTTGTQGIFLIDERSLAVTAALAARMLGAWLGLGDVLRIVLRGGRMAMVNATGGHFASAIAAARLVRRHKKRVAVFPVAMPLPEMVAGLNTFRPAVIAPYASMAGLLANEQHGGRLRIDPVLLVLSAEGLPLAEYGRISVAFNAKVRDSYAATECPFLSYRCEHGWLHVNSDWVILEPVDAEYKPVEPGERSHTVLVTNLANRVQPVLRYDLGDSVVQRPDACPCGNPLQAIRVYGRTADMITFQGGDGEQVTIAPLAFGPLIDRVRGVKQFQILQTSLTSLRVRLRLDQGTDKEAAWQAVYTQFGDLLSQHNLAHVRVEFGDEVPERSAGGKYREVIPLR